jgi:hypothetical protein
VVAEVAGREAVEGGTAHRVLLRPGAGRRARALSWTFRRDGGRMREWLGLSPVWRGRPKRLRYELGLSLRSPVT